MLTEAQRDALGALADCFAEDGIVIDAQNIRAALAGLQDAEFRAVTAEADAIRLRSQLDEARQRIASAEATALSGGWKHRADIAEAEALRFKRERDEARATAHGILASLKEQGEAADAAEAHAAMLSVRIGELENALRHAMSVMRSCVALTVAEGCDPPAEASSHGSVGPSDAIAEQAEDAVASDQATDAHDTEAADRAQRLAPRQDDRDGHRYDGEDEQNGHREDPSES